MVIAMGNLCCNRKKEKKKISLLLVGLDNAGKSVAVKGLAGEPLDTVLPTIGLSVVYLKFNNYIVKVFDLGGGSNIRGIWQRYFVYVHGVVFVIDASDYLRLDEAREVLTNLLCDEKISGKPVLLLANKQDCQEALDELDLVEKLQLEQLVNKKQCPTLVETCSATDIPKNRKVDPGIQKGYNWLVNYIIKNYPQLNPRVEYDVQQQEIKEHEERLEKLERLRKLNEAVKKDDDVIELYSDYNQKMNGNLANFQHNSVDDQNEIYYIHTTAESTSHTSSKSTDSFPHTYYINSEQRPKSTVQLVKQQLELNNIQRRPSFMHLISNKTAPVRLYGVRQLHSATVRRKSFLSGRKLKSAGDPISEPRSSRELFRLNNFQKNYRVSPFKKISNDDRWAQNCLDKSTLSVIDID